MLDHPGGSLRASREAVVRCVAPLGKDMPLPARRTLRFFMPSGAIASQLAEPINITLAEYCHRLRMSAYCEGTTSGGSKSGYATLKRSSSAFASSPRPASSRSAMHRHHVAATSICSFVHGLAITPIKFALLWSVATFPGSTSLSARIRVSA